MLRRKGLYGKNPQRVAWTILLAAFTVFCVLVLALPMSARALVLYSTYPQSARIEPLAGTILVTEPGSNEPIGVTLARDVSQGSRLRTDEVARGILTLSRDGTPGTVLGTVQLFSNSSLTLEVARSPRFAISEEPDVIELKLEGGRVRVLTSRVNNRPLDVVVRTPHGEAYLEEGSVSVSVSNQETQVAVRSGSARVTGQQLTINLESGQRSAIPLDQAPTSPLPAAQNLLRNSDFSDSLQDTWVVSHYEMIENVTAGRVEVVDVGGRNVVTFTRRGEEGIHTRVGIAQDLGYDVRDFEMLIVRFDVRLLYQSLPGAGQLSSEFPLMVRLDYTDIYGKDQFWVYGFYYEEPDPGRHWPIHNGERIPPAVWYPYESPNLFESLSASRPARLNSIQLYASGHNYQSQVAEVGLIVH